MTLWFRWLTVATVPVLAAPTWLPATYWPGAFALAAAVIAFASWRLWTETGWGLSLLSAAVIIAAMRAPLAAGLPHMGGYALGLVVAFWTLEYGRQRSMAAFLVAANAAMIAGLLFVRVDSFKFLPLAVTNSLPQLGRWVSFLGGEGRVNPNALSGLCLLVLPLAWAARRPTVSGSILWRGAAWALFLLSSSALIVLQSRAAWLAALVTTVCGLCLLAIRRPSWRPAAAALLALLLGAAALAWWLDPKEVERILVSGWSSIDRRRHVWQAGWSLLIENLWWGVGLDRFRHIYVPPAGAIPNFDVAHAHNIFLQMVLDVGLVGAAGYLVLLLRTMTVPATSQLQQAVVVALAAIHLFGLSDAIALGTKMGIFQWWIMAIGWTHFRSAEQRLR